MPNPPKSGPNVVTLIAVPVLILAVVVVGFVIFGGKGILSSGLKLAPVTIKLTYNGEPLKGATIITQPTTGGGKGAIGFETKTPGIYKLSTDGDEGVFVDGATLGDHKVTVELRAVNNSTSTPPLLTPKEYASTQDTPVTITVKKAGLENYEIKMTGEDLDDIRAALISGRPGGRTIQPPGSDDTDADDTDADDDDTDDEGDDTDDGDAE